MEMFKQISSAKRLYFSPFLAELSVYHVALRAVQNYSILLSNSLCPFLAAALFLHIAVFYVTPLCNYL